MPIHTDCRSSSSRVAQGFTLVELLVAIAVVAILATLALPNFRDLAYANRVKQTAYQLRVDLQTARGEALRRRTLVALISNSVTNNWSSGWYVETDDDRVNSGVFSGNPPAGASKDVVLSTNPGVDVATGYSITTAVTAAGGPGITPTSNMIIFNAQGNLISRATSFDINVCRPDHKPALSKRITIVNSGLVTTQANTAASPAPPCS